MQGVDRDMDHGIKQIQVFFTKVLETRQPQAGTEGETGRRRVVMGDIHGMLQGLTGHRLRLVHLEVLREGSSPVVDFALQIGLDARGETEFRDVLIVPMHGKVIVEAGRVGARLDGEVVRAVVDIDAIAVTRAYQRKVGRQAVGEDMAPPQRGAAVAIAQTHHLLHRELVVSIVKRKEQTVVLAEALRHLGVHVVEVDLRLVEVISQER